MARLTRYIAPTLGMSAALSMAASPVMAADLPIESAPDLPVQAQGAFDIEQGNAQHHRSRRYRRNRVDAGDVIAGVLVLGTIAAVASAASNSRKDRDRRTRDVRPDDRDYQPRRGDARYDGTKGIDSAVSMCVNSIERDVRVDRVDNVNRNANGWQVTGTIYNGDGFSCQINNRGEIENVSYGDRYSAQAPVVDQQHGADRYAAAWDKVEREEFEQTRPVRTQQAASDANYGEARYTADEAAQKPAYPGGPIAGEVDGDLETEGRTRIAQANEARR